MPDEEINIRVNQTSSGDAISKAQAEIARLKELEQGYRDKGIDSAANSVRSERTRLETDTNKLIRERTAGEKAASREHLTDQRKVTAELREQGAVAKARGMHLARGVQAFEGQAGVGGLGGIGALTNPAALAAVAIGAALGKAVSLAVERADDRAESAARSTGAGNRRGRIAGRSDSVRAEAEAAAEEEENRHALEDAKDRRGSFHNVGMANRFLGIFGAGDGDRANRQNELEIARLEASRSQDKTLAKEKFLAGPGGLGLGASEAEARGDYRGARALRMKAEREKEYSRLVETVGEELANKSADLKIFNEEKGRVMASAGRLVNARSGNADVAAAAGFAQGGASTVFERMNAAVERLHGSVQENHRDVFNLTRGRKY